MNKVTILGVPVHSITKKEALDQIEAFIASGQPHQIITVNSEFIIEAQKNKKFHQVLNGADLSLADSTGVTWATRYKHQPLPERIPGADFIHDIARVAEQRDWKFYLIGGRMGVAERAARQLNVLYPRLLIVGAEEGISKPVDPLSPMFNSNETESLMTRIRRANPDILLVAFGAPKQDLFIAEFKKKLNVPVMIGVGGTFDFLAGLKKRAPALLRRFGLEWFWRLLQEPSRIGRIMNAVIVFTLKVVFSK